MSVTGISIAEFTAAEGKKSQDWYSMIALKNLEKVRRIFKT